MEIIPEKLRKLWSDEEIRILVLLSLFLQIILISFSLFRKRSANKALSLLLWLSYLGADYIAMLALGNLLNKQNDAVEANTSGDIMAFWAPFLLLHLGGPDTITSYSLEDNELWGRHFLNLVAEVVVAVAVFLESLPSPYVWKSAILVFAAGIIKYFERTASLYSASMENLRESMLGEADPGPNYAKFMQELHSRQEASVKVEIKIEKEPAQTLPQEEAKDISETEVISKGFHFFIKTLKRLTVDLMLSFQDRIESQNFFLQRNAKQAFQVVEVELSFLHDILHTKAVHVHKTRGRITRVASLAIAILAFLLFHHRSAKDSHIFKSVDVLITYLLLLIAIGLEIVAILLLIFSDWTIVTLQMSSSDRLEQPYIANVKKILLTPKCSETIINIRQRFLSVFPEWLLGDTERWWSNKMRQYNLLEVCLRAYNYKWANLDRTPKLVKFMDEKRNQWLYVKPIRVVDEIKKHIFDQLKMKAKSTDSLAENYKRLRACRGEWVLREKGYTNLKWSVEKEFDESILIWHIATYLCYQIMSGLHEKTDSTDDAGQVWSIISKFCAEMIENGKKLRSRMKSSIRKKFHTSIGRITQIVKTILRRSRSQQDYMTNKLGDGERESRDGENEEDEEGSPDSSAVGKTATGKADADKTADEIKKLVDISRKISEYLIYLVVYQPQLLPAGIGKIRFIDTCAEAKKFFSDKETEMREELQNIRPEEGEKKTTIFRISGFLFFRPIGSLFIQCFAESIKRVPISKELVQYIRNRWTAITKIVLLKKIHLFFCFCIEVAKEIMQPKNKKAMLEMKRLGCKKLMEVRTTVEPIQVKGDRSKSVLFDAVKLAREIMDNFKNEGKEQKNMKKMWEVMSSVWVEMLCYAAGNCASYAHGRQLSQGGELVTHVWLLMTHMGIGEQYRIEAGHARAKLLVET